MADEFLDDEEYDEVAVDVVDLESRPMIDAQSWEDWRLDAGRMLLGCFNPAGLDPYEIELDRCRTAAEVLDWIYQLQGKTWAQGRSVAGLISAFNSILGPQRNLCPHGQAREITPDRLVELVEDAGRRGAPTYGPEVYDDDDDE